MEIFKTVERFHPRSGKKFEVKELFEVRCDFSGKVIDEDEGSSSYPSYILDYGDSDPCFGSGGEEYDFGQEFGVDVYQFLSQKYVFYSSYGADNESDACAEMISQQVGASFADMCRSSRIVTARKLIADGTIAANQLYEEK